MEDIFRRDLSFDLDYLIALRLIFENKGLFKLINLNLNKQEILDLARQMKTSAEEYENLQECKDAADAHETFYPNLCDV